MARKSFFINFRIRCGSTEKPLFVCRACVCWRSRLPSLSAVAPTLKYEWKSRLVASLGTQQRHCWSVANDTQCGFCHPPNRSSTASRIQRCIQLSRFFVSIKSHANVKIRRCGKRVGCKLTNFKSHLPAALSGLAYVQKCSPHSLCSMRWVSVREWPIWKGCRPRFCFFFLFVSAVLFIAKPTRRFDASDHRITDCNRLELN